MTRKLDTVLQRFRDSGLASSHSERHAEEDMANIFKVISDRYRKENLHSDILSFLLRPFGSHKKNAEYLGHFIGYLNGCFRLRINPQDYLVYDVSRESDRIDLLIEGRSGVGARPHAIIVENKITGAVDRDDQLPRYYARISERIDRISKQRIQVDAVLYVTMNDLKNPDESTWRSDDPALFRKKVTKVRACTGKSNDLIRGWLIPATTNPATDPRYRMFVEQYVDLLRHLGGLVMPYEDSKRFYEFMRSGDNFQTFEIMRDLVVGVLQPYQRQVIHDRFKERHDHDGDDSPFKHFHYDPGNGVPLFRGLRILPEEDIKLLLESEGGHYKVTFYNQKAIGEGHLPWVDAILEKLSRIPEFKEEEDAFVKRFTFPDQESEFFSYVGALLDDLAEMKSPPQTEKHPRR